MNTGSISSSVLADLTLNQILKEYPQVFGDGLQCCIARLTMDAKEKTVCPGLLTVRVSNDHVVFFHPAFYEGRWKIINRLLERTLPRATAGTYLFSNELGQPEPGRLN